jgi:hypothetical protein
MISTEFSANPVVHWPGRSLAHPAVEPVLETSAKKVNLKTDAAF